jgi:predicted CXXCH cytochrome family protein
LNKSRQLVSAVLLSSLIFCLPALCVSAQVENEGWVRQSPHNFGDEGSCLVCHISESPELLADSVTTCTKCHPGNVGNHPVVRHPMGKAPGRQLPISLPVSDDGLMVCSTCHEQHSKARNPSMLRVSYSKLCASCHNGY